MRSPGLAAAVLTLALLSGAVHADPIKIGVVKVPASGIVFIAQEKGYFAAEGVPAEIVYFGSGQPVAVGVASGDLDFGATAVSAAFYSLAGQGSLRVIAAAAEEMPGFPSQAFIVSNQAAAAGFAAVKDFPGHSYAVSQVGSNAEYALGLMAEKYGFPFKSVTVLPMQSIGNAVSAVAGGRADATLNSYTAEEAVLARGSARLLAYVGDEKAHQFGMAFTRAALADKDGDRVERFLRAYRRGAQDYHDAFADADGKRRDGPTAPEILAIIAKYVGVPVEEVRNSVAYVDGQARLDVRDALHQIAWYKSQGFLKGEADGDALIDKRYVIPLP